MKKETKETFFLLAAFVGITLILTYSEYKAFGQLNLPTMLLNFILMMMLAWVCYVVGTSSHKSHKAKGG